MKYGWYIYKKSILYQWLVFRTNTCILRTSDQMHPWLRIIFGYEQWPKTWKSLCCIKDLHSKKDMNLMRFYKYWFKMLERLKFPSLIKACASSTNCTMGNLICSRPMQHTYILQSMLNLMRFISFLLCKSLIQHRLFQVFGNLCLRCVFIKIK
jgi:hypothetical protein